MNGSNKVVNKRKQFSLNEKINILKQIDGGKKQTVMDKELGIAATKLPTVLKDRAKIVKLYERSALCPSRRYVSIRDRQEVQEAEKHGSSTFELPMS
jgi:hypothetical protein